MSAPKRGMVAGQTITTQAQTKEFDEGFDRIFGERKPGRGRYRVDPETNELVPLNPDWDDAPRRAMTATEELTYRNLRATDGTDISGRTKHREYMKANGLSMASDFKEHWQRAEKRREEVLSGKADSKERREIIGRALHEARSKPRR